MILEAVARPIVFALTGESLQAAAPVTALAHAVFLGRPGWTWYVPARLFAMGGATYAEPLALRSAHTSLLARASGYAILGEDASRIEAGATVRIHRFSAGGAPLLERSGGTPP